MTTTMTAEALMQTLIAEFQQHGAEEATVAAHVLARDTAILLSQELQRIRTGGSSYGVPDNSSPTPCQPPSPSLLESAQETRHV